MGIREKIGQNFSATVAVVLFLGSILFLTIEMAKNSELEENLNKELLAKESLLSEKLALAKEVAISKSKYKDIREKNSDLENSIKLTQRKLSEANDELGKLKKQNASVSQLNKQNKKLSALNSELEAQQKKYQGSLDKLQKLSEDMNLMVALLEQQNNELRNELNALKHSSMNEILIASTKRNDKLTIAAKRTKKLIAKFDIASDTNDLKFKIVSPSGKELGDADGTISINTQPCATSHPETELTYSSVEMIYASKQKLQPGIYSIKIFSDAKPVGSLQVKLR